MRPVNFDNLRLDPALASELREIAAFHNRFAGRLFVGSGDPEAVVAAGIGSLFLREDGGTGTSLYVKEDDDGLNTGWVAK
jgi:hypothetical protein